MDPHFDGVIFQTHAGELDRRLRREFPAWCVLDVRPAEEYAAGHLPGARSVSPTDLAVALPEGTDAGTEFFVVGSGTGDPAVRPVSKALQELGARRIVELAGGVAEWTAFDFALERPAA